MKICIIADMHLPYIKDTAQYRAFDFALNDAEKKNAELIVFAGDETANGDENAVKNFYDMMNGQNIPYLVIPGNFDLRSGGNPIPASPVVSELEDFKIIMLNDSGRTLNDTELSALGNVADGDMAFMHHPPCALEEPYRGAVETAAANHKGARFFYAHLHEWGTRENFTLLPALDPDKNIGENPCFVYYDTDKNEIEKSYYSCPLPVELIKLAGISCYNMNHAEFCAENGFYCMELRPGFINYDRKKLIELIKKWRESGGENLSVHFPDVEWKNGEIMNREKIFEYTDFVKEIGAQRITVHVPFLLNHEAEQTGVIESIGRFYGEFINRLPEDCVVGIENLHMKEKYRKEGIIPFGFIPEECLRLMNETIKNTNRKVGINLDLGHARNNAPLSEKYTLGAWYAEVGRFCVGYHIHQVTGRGGNFENHTPVTENYGRLISLASFYDSLRCGQLNFAPMIFEIRTPGGAEITMDFIKKERNRLSV